MSGLKPGPISEAKAKARAIAFDAKFAKFKSEVSRSKARAWWV